MLGVDSKWIVVLEVSYQSTTSNEYQGLTTKMVGLEDSEKADIMDEQTRPTSPYKLGVKYKCKDAKEVKFQIESCRGGVRY